MPVSQEPSMANASRRRRSHSPSFSKSPTIGGHARALTSGALTASRHSITSIRPEPTMVPRWSTMADMPHTSSHDSPCRPTRQHSSGLPWPMSTSTPPSHANSSTRQISATFGPSSTGSSLAAAFFAQPTGGAANTSSDHSASRRGIWPGRARTG
jgi:hypothetical protein